MEAFKCPSCGLTTWGNLKFCPHCGAALNVTCEACGYSLRYFMAVGMNFCPKCGGKMKTESKSKHHEKKS
ncbi:MAG: zinc ribbon domain-containing protein [bacterium]|nr:zinc ribbon domain-containing protein [bacterium]